MESGEKIPYCIKNEIKWPKSRVLTIANADEVVEQQELSFIAGEDAKWYSHFGRQFGSFSQN